MLFEIKKQNPPKSLSDRYIVPPFSVFHTHQDYFRNRLRMWENMGLYTDNGRGTCSYDNRRMDKRKKADNKRQSGVSKFNPVVTEVMYKWFTPHEKSWILDPFAGGITRGGIAAMLGHNYVGYDINKEQIDANYDVYSSLESRYNIEGRLTYVNASSNEIQEDDDNKFDFLLTCPPYYNLERYTDSENDLSNASDYNTFLSMYSEILRKCYSVMDEDTFAVIVVSDVRDKTTTEYLPLVADTTTICRNLGWKYYNEIILYNDTGSLAITSGDYLRKARKVGRQHQNILIFYKGNPRNIKNKFGEDL